MPASDAPSMRRRERVRQRPIKTWAGGLGKVRRAAPRLLPEEPPLAGQVAQALRAGYFATLRPAFRKFFGRAAILALSDPCPQHMVAP